ncbi:MAG: hypothetical protein HFH32_17190 [Eubacterium sp.]|jgi:hypothetical protein|nr:hypothetical protein [Eubacterium sp.]
MTIGGISGSYNPYAYAGASFSGNAGAQSQSGSAGTLSGRIQPDGAGQAAKVPAGTDDEHKVKSGRKSSPAECQTCKERKYQDGSNETDVSFKAPGHISPQASASTVKAHEQQHVANAYEKAAKNNGKVVSCSVSLRTSVCPECGTSYVAGGTTSTSIAYPNESNPYQKNKKAQDAIRLKGANVDYVA